MQLDCTVIIEDEDSTHISTHCWMEESEYSAGLCHEMKCAAHTTCAWRESLHTMKKSVSVESFLDSHRFFSAIFPLRAMETHNIPLVLLDGIFLSCIVHAVDHVLYDRVSWGIKFKLDFMSPRPGTW